MPLTANKKIIKLLFYVLSNYIIISYQYQI